MGKTYKSMGWHFLINKIGGSVLFNNRLRKRIYKLGGIKNIQSLGLRDNLFFYSDKIKIGKEVFINRGCYFYNFDLIEIGDRCSIAPEVMFCTTSHEIGDHYRRTGELTSAPIRIGQGCWIGTRATILPGVSIGDGCIIAAGAIVTKDCEPNGVYAGVPAKRIKELPIGEHIKQVG